MAGPNAPYTQLDESQVIRQSFDESTDRLRVDAEITATIGVLEVEIDAADGDNIAISDGVKNATITTVAAKNGLDVNIINTEVPVELSAGSEVQITDGTDTLAINTNGSINVEAVDLDIRNLNAAQDSVTAQLQAGSQIQITDGTNTLDVNVDGSINVKDSDALAVLNSIDSGIPAALGQQTAAASMSVVLASDQPSLDVDAGPIRGTIDGTPSGTAYTFVNNLRQQILAAHDRNQNITYADFGTKNQRITQIDYTSATFAGITARKLLSYTLVGTRYRRDSIDWSIIP